MKIVFQGDSITDCGRDYQDDSYLGQGYVQKVKEHLDIFYGADKKQVINRGISGNRAIDLCKRWEKDCIELKPDVLSILVGVNDCWRRYDSGDVTTVEAFERHYRELLDRTKQALPHTRIILLEPFLLPVNEEMEGWYEDLDPKKRVIKKLAREYKTNFIPLDGLFVSACAKESVAYWAKDGVHPTDEGHDLIAKEWISIWKQYNYI